jgi:hypothetical protein
MGFEKHITLKDFLALKMNAGYRIWKKKLPIIASCKIWVAYGIYAIAHLTLVFFLVLMHIILNLSSFLPAFVAPHIYCYVSCICVETVQFKWNCFQDPNFTYEYHTFWDPCPTPQCHDEDMRNKGSMFSADVSGSSSVSWLGSPSRNVIDLLTEGISVNIVLGEWAIILPLPKR